MKKILALIATAAITLTLAPTTANAATHDKKKKTPPAVAMFRAEGKDRMIALTWRPSRKNADNRMAYQLRRDGIIIETDTAANIYVDTPLTPNTRYTYQLKSWRIDSRTNKRYYVGTSTVTGLTLPGMVVGIRQAGATPNTATIAWQPPEYSANPVTYNLYLNGNLMAYNVPDTTYTFTNLKANSYYTTKIVTRNPSGVSIEYAYIAMNTQGDASTPT